MMIVRCWVQKFEILNFMFGAVCHKYSRREATSYMRTPGMTSQQFLVITIELSIN